jgi:ATP/maltotriose-dependent transcriptional regulator MalT
VLSAPVHAVRGSDGEGAVVLHRALLAARTAERPALAADILRELAFADVQAGRHTSADRALREASEHACDDPGLLTGILAIQGMNQADRGRHFEAAELLTESAVMARKAGRARQEAWSQGVLARSLLLAGQVQPAQEAAERSTAVALSERWNAFLPWPQVLHAQCLAAAGRWDEASQDAEHAFALACELGDPCWEGMAARVLGLLALHAGDLGAAQVWLADARRRCDRVPDRYLWVSAYIGLAQLETATLKKLSRAGDVTSTGHLDLPRCGVPPRHRHLPRCRVPRWSRASPLRIRLAAEVSDHVNFRAQRQPVAHLSGRRLHRRLGERSLADVLDGLVSRPG